MKLSPIILLFAALLLAANSCKNNETSAGKDSTSTAAAPIKGKVGKDAKLLRDSTEFFWNETGKLTAQKYKDIARLLQEISYTDKYDVLELKRCQQKLQDITAIKFDPHTMDVNEVDKLDMAEDSLINRSFDLAARTPGIEQHPIVNTLMEDINNANGTMLISYRARYDHYAVQLNDLIDGKSEKLSKLPAPYNSTVKYKTFSGE